MRESLRQFHWNFIMRPWLSVLLVALPAYAANPVVNESAAAPSAAGQSEDLPSLTFANGESISNPPPRYPAASRKAREDGRVLLRVVVGVDGRAKEISVIQSSGYARLDDSAVDAVRRWRFFPARKEGELAEGSLEVPISFSLGKTAQP